MQSFRKILTRVVLSEGQLAELILTSLGIISLVVGLIVMPSLGLTLAEFYAGLLALVAFMVLCFCAGQLVVIREALKSHEGTRKSLDEHS
jgi:F0F1-type ATP synthase assembly protein I